MPTLHTTAYVRANTDTIAYLYTLYVIADADNLSNNLMSHNERQLALAPALLEGVNVRATDATVRNSDFDIVGLKGLGLELSDVEVAEAPRVCIVAWKKSDSCVL